MLSLLPRNMKRERHIPRTGTLKALQEVIRSDALN